MQEQLALNDIAAILHEARKTQGMTQARVAQLAGISRPRYRDIESGTAAPRITTLIAIARSLGLDVMLLPQRFIPAVEAMMTPGDPDDDRPAFAPRHYPEDDDA